MSGARYLIGLDAGGGGGRCVVVDADGGEARSAARSWKHPRVTDRGSVGTSLDLEAIWRALGETVREALKGFDATPDQVVGIACTSMRHSLVIVDSEGRDLHSAPNRDARAIAEGLQLAAEYGPEIYERTGHWPLPLFAAARLLRLAQNEPDVLERAKVWYSLSDWLTHRLCGEAVTERSQAGGSGLFELRTGTWSLDLIERLGLPAELCAPLVAPGTQAGRLTPEAAGSLGLVAGTPVMVGGADTQCGLLGVGAIEPGEIAAIVGTTAPVQLVLAQPDVDPEMRLWTGHHVLPERWVLESNAGAVGEAATEFARMLYPDSPQPMASALADAAYSMPGAHGIFSTLGATVMNARELTLPVSHLTFTHVGMEDSGDRRAHFARGIAEGLAYALRANVAQLQAFAGDGPSRVRLGGGIARSQTFAGILADVLNSEVEASAIGEATALGAAICAGVGAGIFGSLPEGVQALVRPGRVHRPDPTRAASYARLFGNWGELRAARADADRLAANVMIGDLISRLSAGTSQPEPALRPRILVTAELDDAGLAALRALGEVEYASYHEHKRVLTGPDLVAALRGFDMLVTEIDVVDLQTLRALPDLRVIAACRGDAVNVDVNACSALGIPVLHAPGRNAEAVADLTLAFLLMLARRLPDATGFLHDPKAREGDLGRLGQAFHTLRGRELGGRTVGLVGLGAIGSAVARRLRAFGARVLVHDPHISPETIFAAEAEPATLNALLDCSDFVSLHADVRDESRGLIGAEQLARMKPDACLVNTARGALVDESALVEALREGQLAGAALDAFSIEPPGSDHPLLQLPNVIATPHVGGNTEEIAHHQGGIIATALSALLRGERPAAILNPDVLTGFDWTEPRPAADEAVLARLAEGPGPSVSDLQRDTGSVPAEPTKRAASLAPAAITIRGKMEQILRAFVDGIRADPKLRARADDKDVTLHFSAEDLDLQFWFRLCAGSVSGDLGPPTTTSEVALRMPAAVLDGMFTGRMNAMDAAMNGELSFTGDAGKAMTLQHLQLDLERLYTAARARVGSPGDLSKLATVGPTPPDGVPARQDDLRETIVQTVDQLFAQQLITATGGNVSARIEGRDELWITPGQMFKGSLTSDALVRIDLAGQPLDPGSRSPSSERMMHCAVYAARPDVKAVVHAHAPHATILANTDLPFLAISTEAAFFGEIPRVPFIMPGTEELAQAIGEAIKGSWAVLMRNHGLLVAARSLRRAADMIEIIERSAEIILGCHAVGKTPPTLPPEIVATLREIGDLVA